MDSLAELLKWSKSKGVVLAGIKPKSMPGRGTGVVTTRKIEASPRDSSLWQRNLPIHLTPPQKDEVLLTVPSSALRTLDTVPKAISRRLPRDITIHGLLAVDLALDATDKYKPWNAVLPSTAEFATMPLLWPPQLQALLPRRAAALLAAQLAKFDADWAHASAAFPALALPAYMRAWLLVNTRTFYHVTPRTEARPRADHMALQPVADLFNHAGGSSVPTAAVAFSPEEFTVTADRAYARGEEVAISYGAHSNDFLLVEYGFVEARNRWDEVVVDDAIVPRLGARQRAQLEDVDFLGNYIVDASTACYRTEVAVRALCMPPREWRRSLAGVDDGIASQGRVDELLVELLSEYQEVARRRIDEIEALTCGEECQRVMLKTRWGQIVELLESTIQGLRT
jgi:hypothetical protein